MRPNLDAIRARLWSASTPAYTFADDVATLLRYIDELERRTTYAVGEAEWAQRIAMLEHMLGEERENVDTLRREIEHGNQRFVDEYDARKAAEGEIAELKARIVVLEAMKP